MRFAIVLVLCGASFAKEAADGLMVVHVQYERTFGGQARRRVLAATALPVDQDGLLLVVGLHIEPPDGRDRDEAVEVSVIYPDGTKVEAEILGGEDDLNYTLFRIKGREKALPVPTVLKAARVEVGQEVVLHSRRGETFGYAARTKKATVTAVTAKPRRMYALAGDLGAWQGSLVTTVDGHAVGFVSHTSTMSTDQGAMVGVGSRTTVVMPLDLFADAARHPPVRKTEKRPAKAWLGVNLAPFDESHEAYYGVGQDWKGAFVTGVAPDSPAARAGIKVFDVLQRIGDLEFVYEVQRDDVFGRLLVEVQKLALNTALECQVVRFKEGKAGVFKPERLALQITLEERPLDFADAPETEVKDLGMTVKPATRTWLSGQGLPRTKGGVVVTEIENGLAAALAGLSVGDHVLSMDRLAVTDVKTFQTIVDKARKETRKKIVFLVRRGRRTTFIAVSTGW